MNILVHTEDTAAPATITAHSVRMEVIVVSVQRNVVVTATAHPSTRAVTFGRVADASMGMTTI